MHGRHHRIVRPRITHPLSARDVDAHAVAADQIGIKGHDFGVLHDPRAAFLKPRVGALARCQKPCFDLLVAAFDVALVQFCPDRVFGHNAFWHASLHPLGRRSSWHHWQTYRPSPNKNEAPERSSLTKGLKVTRKGEFLYSHITIWPSAQIRQARKGLWLFYRCKLVVSVAWRMFIGSYISKPP